VKIATSATKGLSWGALMLDEPHSCSTIQEASHTRALQERKEENPLYNRGNLLYTKSLYNAVVMQALDP